jgi:hypothetical protein
MIAQKHVELTVGERRYSERVRQAQSEGASLMDAHGSDR